MIARALPLGCARARIGFGQVGALMESRTVVEEMQSINFALDACGVIGSEF